MTTNKLPHNLAGRLGLVYARVERLENLNGLPREIREQIHRAKNSLLEAIRKAERQS